MKRGFKALAVLAALVAVSAGPQIFAFCDSSRETPAIFGIAERTWFEPAPAGAGAVSGVFWGVGFGNNTVNTGLDSRGVGMTGASTFNGNDSGIWVLNFIDASTVLPQAPPGALGLGANNWANAGVDGCSDNPRDAAQPASDDNLLNPIHDVYAAISGYPGLPSTEWVQDAPMGVLLTESSGHWFALAAVQNMERSDPTDIRQGFYNLGDVTNGNQNPITGQNNIVPWQRVPGDRDPGDATTNFVRAASTTPGDRVVDLGWKGAVVHSDGSVRPSTNAAVNAIGLTGMGVADHGSLVRYVIESQAIVNPSDPIGSLNPAGWSPLAPAVGPDPDGMGGFTAQAVVPPDTCLRLHTYFGAAPQTTTHTVANCRRGLCGDIGYEVVSGPACVGGALAADGVIKNAKAVRDKGGVDVSFDTTSELSVRDYKVFALTGASGSVEVASLSCLECTTGGGAKYATRIAMGQLKGARELEIVSSTGSRVKVSVK